MKRIMFVTVSDDRAGRKGGVYGQTQKKILKFFSEYNPSFGITDYLFLTFDDIVTTDFYRDNLILRHPQPHMNGRCYKPYAILEGLNKLNDGDFLIYNDVSPELWNFDLTSKIDTSKYSVEIIKKLCLHNGGILTAYVNFNPGDGKENYHRHEFFTLDRCMKRMGLEDYRYSVQHASGMMVLQKSEKSVQFLKEWLHYNAIDECASMGKIHEDPEKSTYEFGLEEQHVKSGHRHDQSISGLLINKMNNKLVSPPNSAYPQYNFLSYCFDGLYYFFESNQPRTSKVLTPVFIDGHSTHQILKPRNDL
jgi:hypothetical protein